MKEILIKIFRRDKIREDGKEEQQEHIKNSQSKSDRTYRYIPLYSEEEMKNALIDDSDEATNDCLGRQAINGYVGLYKDKWVVGKRRDGKIVKTCKNLLFETLEEDKMIRNQRIEKTQNRAVLGEELKDEIFCKFTYDKIHQDDFATHVTLVREYEENVIMEDCGDYGGIHFVPIDNIDLCTDIRNTLYGDKIAILNPMAGEVYYEYMDNTFIGQKIFVTKVMNLSNVNTWIYLNQQTKTIRENKDIFINYLKALEEKVLGEEFKSSILYLESL